MEFWEEEYQGSGSLGGERFDWFFAFEDLPLEFWRRQLFDDTQERAKKKDVLVVGCGHSSLSGGLARAFPETTVVSVDSSASCIERMRREEPELAWHAADARRLSALPGDLGAAKRYDVVVDKGLLDAVLGYERQPREAARQCVAEVRRVLKEGGRCVVFACTRRRDAREDLDGLQGGAPTCVELFSEKWLVETLEIPAPKDRGLAPSFDDVRPSSYALVRATKRPPWSDYADYYGGDVEPHEAFLSWATLEPALRRSFFHRQRSSHPTRLLEIGCGNSAVGAALAALPGVHYVGVDVVPEAIRQQRRRYPHLDLRVADARHLSRDLANCPAFDVAFDKGTADALFIYDDDHGNDDHVHQYLAQLEQVLDPHGGLLLVVGCAREDGILAGDQAPRLWTHVARPRRWTLLAHDLLYSDVGAGDRSFDFLVLRVPSSSSPEKKTPPPPPPEL